MARNAPSHTMASSMQTIIHQLLTLTQENKEVRENDVYLFEIAISALASLVLFGPFANLKFVNRDIVLNVFFQSLPLQHDDDEAKVCHAGFCNLIENGVIDLQAEAPRITSIAG